MTTTSQALNAGASDLNEHVRIGATLRALREARGFRPEEFAAAVNISRPYLVNIERGRKRLTDVLLARMATVLNVRQVAIMSPQHCGVGQ